MSNLPSNNNSSNNASSLDFHSLSSSSSTQTCQRRRTFKFLVQRHHQPQVMDLICRRMGGQDGLMLEHVSSVYLDTPGSYKKIPRGASSGMDRTQDLSLYRRRSESSRVDQRESGSVGYGYWLFSHHDLGACRCQTGAEKYFNQWWKRQG